MQTILSLLSTIKNSACSICILPIKEHVYNHICVYKIVFHYPRSDLLIPSYNRNLLEHALFLSVFVIV